MSNVDTLTVIVGGLDELARLGFEAALRKDTNVSVLASGLDEVALERAVLRLTPRVVVVDDSADHAVLARLQARQPGLGVLVLAHSVPQLFGTAMLALGVSCLPWSASAADVLAAVYGAGRGAATYLGLDGHQAVRGSAIAAGALTPREMDVLTLLVQGKKYSQIGHDLDISPETARKHSSRICRKLGKSRLELVGRALPNGTGDTHS
jgi:DNA-binding NarL/FixJ family response regulator